MNRSRAVAARGARVGRRQAAANTATMGVNAAFLVLADTATSLQRFVWVFYTIYVLMLLAHILLSSWIRLPYSRTGDVVQQFLSDVSRPYLNLFRGRIPTLGPFDLSPIVAILVLGIAARLLIYVIGVML